MNLTVNLAPRSQRGLVLANPVIAASGTFGYGTEYQHPFDIERLGAIICKGTTLEPRPGNPQPRIAETACGILNSIGLQNIGIDSLLKEKCPIWASWKVPVIVNIAGNTVDEYARLAEKLDGSKGVAGIEVNISCPNVKSGCLEFGADCASAASVTSAVRAATRLPVWVKLTPNAANITDIAGAVAEAGADALVVANTLKGLAIDVHRRRAVLGNITGGLSGPAVKPVALRIVYEVYSAVKYVPIVGSGGIITAEDALEFLMAGATAVQVGTANLVNPRAPLEIIEGIESYLKQEGLSDVNQLTGLIHRQVE